MCTPFFVKAFRYAANAIVKVFPSPVFISAILFSWRTIPPIIWTSKWRSFVTLLEASLANAKASGSIFSKDVPFLIFSINSLVFNGKSLSSNFKVCSSNSLIFIANLFNLSSSFRLLDLKNFDKILSGLSIK